MDKKTSDIEIPFEGEHSEFQSEGVSVFGIHADNQSFEPIFKADNRHQAQTILDKLCENCEDDCENWKRDMNACYRIVSNDKD